MEFSSIYTKQAKLTAFYEIQKNLTERQPAVLLALSELGGTATMHATAEQMGVPLNTISGRFSELRNKEYIQEIGHTTDDKRKKTLFMITINIRNERGKL